MSFHYLRLANSGYAPLWVHDGDRQLVEIRVRGKSRDATRDFCHALVSRAGSFRATGGLTQRWARSPRWFAVPCRSKLARRLLRESEAFVRAGVVQVRLNGKKANLET